MALHYADRSASDDRMKNQSSNLLVMTPLTELLKKYIKAQTYDKNYTPLHSAINASISLEVFQLLIESFFSSIIYERQPVLHTTKLTMSQFSSIARTVHQIN